MSAPAVCGKEAPALHGYAGLRMGADTAMLSLMLAWQ